MAGVILFIVAFFLLALGYPVAFSLGGISLIVLWWMEPALLGAFPSRIFGVMSNPLLMAVPLFVYMGVMLEKSGLAEELLDTMALLFGRLRGGLAISVVVVGALLAASTGIVGATVVTMGMLSLPTMLRRNYSAEVATGTIAASGTLGQIIPPSIVLVLLGDVMNVNIGDMFIGALIPGLLLVALYLIYIVVFAWLRPNAAPAMPADELAEFTGLVALRRTLTALVPPLLLIMLVLGSIFAGVASPTEAAAVGALGATLLTVFKSKLNYTTGMAVMRETVYLSCMVFIILVGATAFGLAFRGLHGDRFLQELISNADLSLNAFLLIFMGVIFIAGFFIDFIEITFIHVPVAAPLLISVYGLSPEMMVWIGILIGMNLQTSFLTPPFGFSLFYLKGVAPPGVRTSHIYKGIIPFVLIQLVGLTLLFMYPQLVTGMIDFMAAR